MIETPALTSGWEPATPIGDSLLRQFVFAYANRIAWMAATTGGQADRDSDVCIADTGSGFGYDNAAVLLRPPGAVDFDDIFHRAQVLLGPERWWVLLSVWPLPDLRPYGLALVGHPPLMVRAPGQIHSRVPADMHIVEVHDHRTLRDFKAVLTEGFQLPAGGPVADARLLGGRLHLYVGYLHGEPVATAGANVAHGLVEVDWVATVPGCRGRGVGAAMTLAATSTDLSLPAALLASDNGRPMYRRLGFMDLLRCTIWERRP